MRRRPPLEPRQQDVLQTRQGYLDSEQVDSLATLELSLAEGSILPGYQIIQETLDELLDPFFLNVDDYVDILGAPSVASRM